MTDSTTVGAKAPLEDLMVTMDVVDTVRHRNLIIDRELNSEDRRAKLMERLREIYRAQGIDVSDAALEAGVDALEKERFGYIPSEDGFATRLAHLYVSRDRWLKPLLLILLTLVAISAFWYFTQVLPAERERAELPELLEREHQATLQVATGADAIAQADALFNSAQRAISADDYSIAKGVYKELQALRDQVEVAYDIRIVSRPDELSGVWRVPSVNEAARNYYLIVEAVLVNGNTVAVPIRSEEDGRIRTVNTWGVRVDEATFEAVAADKRNDGIIQDDIIGVKPVGKITPEYRIRTTGATILEW